MRNFWVKTEVSAYVLIYLALAAFILPLRWLGALLIAAGVHEAGHLLLLKIMNVPIHKFSIDLSGAKIQTADLSYGQDLLCTCAGPAAGGLLMLCGEFYPELAICAFAQSVYNLLPVLPYDGGRVLRCLVMMLFPQNVAQGILCGAEWFLYTLIIGFGIFFVIQRLFGFALVIIGAFFLLLAKRKIACKGGFPAVQ